MGNAQHKVSPAGWAAIIVGGGLAFYWMYTYTGPFEWFAELQLRWMGRYIEKLTFLLTFLVAYGALALIYVPVRRVLRAGAGGSAEPARGGGRDLSLVTAYFVASLVGLGFIVSGAVQYARAQRAHDLAVVPLTELESGLPPASRWARVSGYPIAESVLWMKTSLGKSYYVLEPNKTPGKAMWEAKIMSNIGLAAFGFAVLLGTIAWFRRPAPAAPVNQGVTTA